MVTHRFNPTRFYNAIGINEPVLEIGDGDAVITSTLDAWGQDLHGEQLADRPNPMTGPFFVRNAEPGDALAVMIDRMAPNRSSGWTFSTVAPNVVDPATVANLPERNASSGSSIDRAGPLGSQIRPPVYGTGSFRSRQ